MSEEYRMLRVQAPSSSTRELLTLRGLRCGHCQGNGWFWSLDDMGQSVKEACRVCQGSGKLNAEITIDYKPFKDLSNE